MHWSRASWPRVRAKRGGRLNKVVHMSITDRDRTRSQADGGRLGERIGHCAAIWKKEVRAVAIHLGRLALRILLTNDDGIYAPGLAAMERELRKHAEVHVSAPATEQSGVGHSITYLTPLLCKQIFEGERLRGYAVEGSPADCVKLAVSQLIGAPVDLVVSGIQWWLECRYQCVVFRHGAAAIEELSSLEQLCCVARV